MYLIINFPLSSLNKGTRQGTSNLMPSSPSHIPCGKMTTRDLDLLMITELKWLRFFGAYEIETGKRSSV